MLLLRKFPEIELTLYAVGAVATKLVPLAVLTPAPVDPLLLVRLTLTALVTVLSPLAFTLAFKLVLGIVTVPELTPFIEDNNVLKILEFGGLGRGNGGGYGYGYGRERGSRSRSPGRR
jgi:hypothetical protein